ncbi:MAG: 4Fe-4S cluster-binding domain-containing protein [Lachnospiraceae bacterium]|nr:4Fe-4S cluster-binding domain-containing protein [Lachnospiraceae bacterium]MBO5425387.1 4Fe-4S cluster-binding domain-containing protein [Lachnospiraceae bacterium]
MPSCTFKCCTEQGLPLETCQNCSLYQAAPIDIPVEKLIERYETNPISQAVVFGGMEPLDTWEDLSEFITKFRERSSDPIVIYTGYTESELTLDQVKCFVSNGIIVKFGRFVPGQKSHYDPVLGVNLISDNQYARDYREG